MTLTPIELSALVADTSTALQTIQDEYGRKNILAARIRFPRGFIRTANTQRTTLPNIGSEVQKRNASYALMTLDIFRWLVVRTDLSGAGLSMIVKEGISIYGALCEWLSKESLRGLGSRQRYTVRMERLVERGVITAKLKSELDWIWEIRCNSHLGEVTALEHELYRREDYNRAVKAYSAFRDALISHHGEI